MLDVARSKFRAGEDVEFQVADATDLPFPDGSFDTVVCQFGVMFYPDKDKGFREADRVLAPGGAICSVCGMRTATTRLRGLRTM
jgi:ubiquinone/menaquinone biosynthesis C-methylase UbiE